MVLEAILVGAGNRGVMPFGKYALDNPDKLKYIGVVEPNEEKRNFFGDLHSISKEYRFSDLNALPEKLSESAFNATNDAQHHDTTIQLLNKGYNVLLEKPMATTLEECEDIVSAARKNEKVLMLMHVLRYAPLYASIKNLVQSDEIGKIKEIEHIEHVGDWHFAHSYVRGNWRNSKTSGPISLTKTCHDFDILYWLIDSKCKSLNSFSKPFKFSKENAPWADVPDHCMGGCNHDKECSYYAPEVYKSGEHRKWMKTAVHISGEENKVKEALKKGPYGRCVYRCDNNVPDYQRTEMLFENGVKVDFTMESRSNEFTRHTVIKGSEGILVSDLAQAELYLIKGKDKKKINLAEAAGGHGGGDPKLINDFINSVNNQTSELRTTAEKSLYSHLLAFKAEESRISGKEIYF